jgi:hypothetical protein
MPTPPRADSLARYDALLRISSQLALHRSIGELVEVLADHLHTVVPFDYLALVMHDDATDHMCRKLARSCRRWSSSARSVRRSPASCR